MVRSSLGVASPVNNVDQGLEKRGHSDAGPLLQELLYLHTVHKQFITYLAKGPAQPSQRPRRFRWAEHRASRGSEQKERASNTTGAEQEEKSGKCPNKTTTSSSRLYSSP